jgi:hypothetical protein
VRSVDARSAKPRLNWAGATVLSLAKGPPFSFARAGVGGAHLRVWRVCCSVRARKSASARATLSDSARNASSSRSSWLKVSAPAGVLWVVLDSGRTWCGRPAASSAADIRSVCATTTLSSAIPWISSSGLVRLAAPVMVEDRS